MNLQEITIVDEDDNELRAAKKFETHRQGLLHRAFSVFVFDKDGNWLLQRRAEHKYHSGGLWSNTCCGHPGIAQDCLDEARKRLWFEMGIDCELAHAFVLRYKAAFENGLIENEIDHVFIGQHNGPCEPNPDEVSEAFWISSDELRARLADRPDSFTAWFKLCFREFDCDQKVRAESMTA